VKKSNRSLHGLCLIRRHFNLKQATLIVTSFYFSMLYYGIEVWFHKHLSFHLKQKIRACHYRALRLLYGSDPSRDQLDILSERAMPDEYSDYLLAKTMAKICISGYPTRLHDIAMPNSYTERRKENRLFFFDNSAKKLGKQSFKNRLQHVSKLMKFEWLLCNVHSLRPKLQTIFLSI
jgi:hypothetical protein